MLLELDGARRRGGGHGGRGATQGGTRRRIGSGALASNTRCPCRPRSVSPFRSPRPALDTPYARFLTRNASPEPPRSLSPFAFENFRISRSPAPHSITFRPPLPCSGSPISAVEPAAPRRAPAPPCIRSPFDPATGHLSPFSGTLSGRRRLQPHAARPASAHLSRVRPVLAAPRIRSPLAPQVVTSHPACAHPSPRIRSPLTPECITFAPAKSLLSKNVAHPKRCLNTTQLTVNVDGRV